MLSVITAKRNVCRSAANVRLPVTEGYISNIVAMETGCGTKDCPWILQAPKGQKIQITLHEFNLTYTAAPPGGCQKYGIIEDGKEQHFICGQNYREKVIFTSKYSELEIKLDRNETSYVPKFLLYFEGTYVYVILLGPT